MDVARNFQGKGDRSKMSEIVFSMEHRLLPDKMASGCIYSVFLPTHPLLLTIVYTDDAFP